MTQVPNRARREEIDRTRGHGLLDTLGATRTAQALRDPGRVARDYWDSSGLPGPVKALLGVARAGLAGVTDVSDVDQEVGRAATGVIGHIAASIPVPSKSARQREADARVQAAWDSTPGGTFEKGKAANEAMAQGAEREIGLYNMLLSPSNLLTAGGAALTEQGAVRGIPALARLGQAASRGGEISDTIQGLPFRPITYAGGKAVQGARYALGGQTTRDAVLAQLERETLAGKLVKRPGLLGTETGVQQALPTVGDLPGTVVDPRAPQLVQQALPLGQAPPGRMAPGGIVPPSAVGGPHQNVDITDAARLLFGDDLPPTGGDEGDVLGLRPGLARGKDARPAPTHDLIAGGQTLDDLLPGEADRIALLRATFPGLGEAGIVSTIIQGRRNQQAQAFAQMIAPNWERARRGLLTEDDVINAYVPAVLSQRRGAVAEGSTFFHNKPGGGLLAHPQADDLLADFRRAAVLPLDDQLAPRLGGLQGEDVGKFRPEDMAARLMVSTPEGQALHDALKSGNAKKIQVAAVNFGNIFPESPFFSQEGGELDRLVRSGGEQRFKRVANLINQSAQAGMSPEDIADPLRYGKVLPGIGPGKGGFVVNNLGGPAATKDTRVNKLLPDLGHIPAADRERVGLDMYRQGLGAMWPNLTTGEAHHALWDAQGFSRTPHLDIAEAVRQVAEQQRPGTFPARGGPDTLAAGLTPQLARDLQGQVGRQTIDDPALTPPLGLAQQARSRYQQAHLNDPARVATDIAANRELARKAYVAHTRTAEGFDTLWERVNDWIEQTKTISMGVGSAKSARAIIDSGQPIANGMARWGVQVGQDFPEKLVQAKAAALGLDKGERKNEAIAYGAALGIANPKEAIRAYARHFLTIEAGSFGRVGLGDPTKDADAVNGMYASVHEGLPGLQQMGGGIHFLIDPATTEYTTSVHHPFSFESPVVLPMHKGTANPLKDTFTPARQAELAQAAGRPAMQQFGEKGEYTISGSPMLVGPAATGAARAAALFMTAQKSGPGGDVLKLAAKGDPERAAALLVRGTPGQARGYSQQAILKAAAETPPRELGPPGVGYNLAQSSSFARTEALVHNLTPENITGVVVKGNNEATVAENAQAARDLMAHYGIDAPIYIAWGPEGDPNPGLYRLTPQGPVPATLNEGRQNLIDTVKGFTNPTEENFGIAPQAAAAVERQGQTPGQWLNTQVLTGVPGGSRLGMMGSTGLAGAAIGGTQGDTDEERRQNAIAGFGTGAALAGGLTSARGYNALRNAPEIAQLGKTLLSEAVTAQKAAQNRKGRGIANLQSLTTIWKVQATSTLRNLLQDEATARLWLSDAGVRVQMMNDNWASLVRLYNEGQRDPYLALPEDTTTMLDALGLHGYEPQVGASFMQANRGIIQQLSAGDTAKGEALLSLANPLQGGIPVLGVALAGAKGYTRAFQQSLFDTLNMFTRVASRHAAFQDTMEKELPGVADRFIQDHGAALAPLAGRDGLFSPQEVEALVPGLGGLWQKNVDETVARAEARAKDILGDYEKKVRGEGPVSTVFPFVSYALRAYPRTAKLMLHHPGASLLIMLAMAKGMKWGQQQGLPGYLQGGVPVGEDTPVAGGVVRALNGGAPGTAYVNLAGALSPVDASLLASDDLPADANAYQQASSLADRAGFGFNPIIKTFAAATNQDYRMPSALSRTAAVEQYLPGPQIPSLAQGPINFAREQAGGTPLETTALDRQIAQVFYRATGHTLNDPVVKRDPRLAALAASTLDPESPISQQALAEVRQAGLARTAVGMTSPVQVTAQSDVQDVQNQARLAAQALPPAVYDPAQVRDYARSGKYALQAQAVMMARANKGTQADAPPEAGITSGAGRTARAYAALEAWQRAHASLKLISPTQYALLERQLRDTLGLP